MDRDERQLVRRCLGRDEDACAQLVEAYARMVGTVIWRATGDHDVVEDLAQETFLRVFRGLPYFDRRAKLSTWIYTIAHRVAIDHRRQTARRPDGSNEANVGFENQPSSGLDPELAASEQRPPVYEGCRGRIVRAAAIGLSAAAAVYVIGLLMSLMLPLVLRDVSSAIDAYARLVERPTQLMTGRAVQVAWLSAAASLSFSASLVLRARA